MNISMRKKIVWAAAAALMLAAVAFSGPVKTVLAAQVSGSDDRVGSTRSRLAGEIEFHGVVESIDGAQIVVSGKAIDLRSAEVKTSLNVGDAVKVHLFARADGSLAATEVERTAQTGREQDDGSTHDRNDDHVGSGTVVEVSGDHESDDGALHDANNDPIGGHGSDDGTGHDASDDHSGSQGTDDGASHDSHEDHGAEHGRGN